ncbi:hypothetical protein SAPIO_CDS8399 [Scedosporium apiospermum]|uniref:CRAL-TRIO domain-containing protein n=1 Tax=Pseudallescheria apiosperma TaxID=563466 RepID=A0A084FZJ1_PSEDA|nr:uncharacterized protein SAPIO_CDS8399 [Scedosporium apiospermum]KEZ40503.1 hypothetical protein SAPIO_CDS8399 [Scedosporium apiospermum]
MATDSGASEPPLHKVQSVLDSDYGYPHGHLGYLAEHETEALDAFKKLAEEEELYKPGTPPSHDDTVLLRYLRARRWSPAEALKQFKDSHVWRKANDLDILYHTIELDSYEQSRRMYPQWTGRRDRRGIPLYLFEIKQLDSKAVAEYERVGNTSTFSKAKSDGKTPNGLLRLFALYENLTHFVMPFCSQLQDREFAGTPITMTTNIVDISGVGLKQFWNLKSHMQAASQLATAHYPETLDRIFIIGAPVFFSTVWGWIKRWFDPITVSKIFILSSHEVEPTLREFIDPKNIPKKYGGELDFSWGQLPTVDPAWDGIVEWAKGHSSFPTGPHVWREIDDGKKMECIGVGQVNGKQREERICIVHKDNVWGGQSLCRTETRDAAPLEADGEVAKLSEEVDDLALSEPEVKEKAAEINGSAGTPVSPAVPA